MPSKQIRTGIPFLQKVNSNANNISAGNNVVLGRNNNVNNTNNLVVGDGNSSTGNTEIFGNNNILSQSNNSMVIGNDNFILSNSSFIVGSSNSISSFNSNVFLMGVSNLNLTQSISEVYMIGPGPAPTQSGIFLNNNVYLGTNSTINGTINGYLSKDIEIGVWNMVATATASVLHGLSEAESKTIRNISVTIREDNDDDYFNLTQDINNTGSVDGSISKWNKGQINLARRTGGAFDNTSFNATASFNRGWITFQYRPD
jgi:hypothetical protein